MKRAPSPAVRRLWGRRCRSNATTCCRCPEKGVRWPASYGRWWAALIERQGQAAGTKAMIGLVQLGRRHGYEALRAAIEQALTLGCHDAAAVGHLLASQRQAPEVAHPRSESLAAF